MNYTGWFNNRKNYIYSNARSYPASSPYPWTRLGYTYDWGSRNHVGLSEFVVHGRKAGRKWHYGGNRIAEEYGRLFPAVTGSSDIGE